MTVCILAAGLVLAAPLPVLANSPAPVPPSFTLVAPEGTCLFSSQPNYNSVTVPLGNELPFDNATGQTATVTDTAGFWSFSIQSNQIVDKPMYHAGTYLFDCDGVSDNAPDHVPVQAPSSASGSFTLKWATSKASSTYRYTVQFKRGSSGAVKTWRNSTSSRSATFKPGYTNVYYYFRAETIRNSSNESGWSPWKKVHVT